MDVKPDANHVVVLRRGQFCESLLWVFLLHWDYYYVLKDWFDVLDENNLPLLTEREVLRNLQAIVTDADKTPPADVCPFPSSFILEFLLTQRNHTGRPLSDRRPFH